MTNTANIKIDVENTPLDVNDGSAKLAIELNLHSLALIKIKYTKQNKDGLKMYKINIHTDQSIGKINRNIYGRFSDHLGRCIYNG